MTRDPKHGGTYAVKSFNENKWHIMYYDAGAEAFMSDEIEHLCYELIEVESYVYLEGGEEEMDVNEDAMSVEAIKEANKAFDSRCERTGINLLDF